MTKFEWISETYTVTLHEITDNQVDWMNFLQSACRNYKCRFDEQVLIYAQRPRATAVLEIERWNQQFGRWVNKGAVGIAVFDDSHRNRPRVKHYFDIADTHESRMSRPVPLWQMETEYESEVIEHLKNVYDIGEKTSSLPDVLISAAKNIVEDNLPDYLQEIQYNRNDSFLEEMDDYNVEVGYKTLLYRSVAYMLLERCGIDGTDYFTPDDFIHVMDYNTPQSANVLGIAVSDIAESCLREISDTVLELQKQKTLRDYTLANQEKVSHNNSKSDERGLEHGTDIQDGGRLSDTESGGAGTGRSGTWQVRSNAGAVSQGAQKGNLRESADNVPTTQPSEGDRGSNLGEGGNNHQRNGEGTRSERTPETSGSDEVGGTHEQHSTDSGGNGLEGNHIHIKPLPTEFEQLSFFNEAGDIKSPAFSGEGRVFTNEVEQSMIDQILSGGGNEVYPENSPYRIVSHFKKDYSIEENADFLREEYSQGVAGGKGYKFGMHRVAVWFKEDGILAAIGDGAINANNAMLITWEQAAKRTRELLDMGMFMSQGDLDKSDELENYRAAYNFYLLYRDSGTEMPEEWVGQTTLHGDCVPAIQKLIVDQKSLADIIQHVENKKTDSEQYDADNISFFQRRYLRNLGSVLHDLKGLQRTQLVFRAKVEACTKTPDFITQDEIDKLLCRGGIIEHGKFRIFHYFLQKHTLKEKETFLKEEYGTGGFGQSGYNEWHDSKGITLTRDWNGMEYDTIKLPWAKVSKRIDELILGNRYMSKKEMDYIPEYEKTTLSREIYNFYCDQPEEVPRPFPYTSKLSDSEQYHEGIKAVRTQLDDPQRVKEILEMMPTVLDNTASFDRNYESMQKAYDDLTAYQNGTFSFFTSSKDKPVGRETIFVDIPIPKVVHDVVPSDNVQAGRIVNIGTSEYEIESISDTNVVLGDMSAPLFTKDMSRDEFERKIRENPLNDDSLSDRSDDDQRNGIGFSIGSTEHPVFYDKKGNDRYHNISFALGNKLLKVLDEKQHRERELYDDPPMGWYHKTNFTIEAKIDGDSIKYEGRFDIGDGDGSLIDHIKAFYEFSLTPNFIMASEWKLKGEDFYQEQIEEIKKERDTLVPFMEQHTELSAEDEKLLQDILSTENEWFRLPDQEVSDITANTIENTEVSGAEEIPNSGIDLVADNSNLLKQGNYRIDTDYHFERMQKGFAHKSKFKGNVEAVRTLKRIESENRSATSEEQAVLSKYVGWGGLAQAFDDQNESWSKEYKVLKELLDSAEYESAKATTLNAHYTSSIVINAMYQAVENMGFKSGNVLEPSCGIGNFFGLVPDSMSDSRFYGVEIDDITGRMVKQLYPQNNIVIDGFENTEFPDSFFDLAIGNVPFGSLQVADRRYDKHKFYIHNYFIAKTLDKVRSGGIIAFITSKGTLDRRNPDVRKYIAQRADLLGAVRLPNNAFKSNAGTEATMDILFLQKRDYITDIMPDWVELGETEDGVPVNRYFASHPEMILGTMVKSPKMYGDADETMCVPFPGSDFKELLNKAIGQIHGEITEYEHNEDDLGGDNTILADPNVRNFSYTIVSGQIYFRQNSRMLPIKVPVTTQSRIMGLIEIRECVRKLIFYQTNNHSESKIQLEQERLNQLYDKYTKAYGLINSRGNSTAFSQDSGYCLLCSLEILDENGKLERKADMFTKRTIRPHIPVTHVDTASDALALSLSEKVKIDFEYMSQLTGMSEEKLIEELEGLIFLNPMHGYGSNREEKYVTSDEYLSGNIREKLEWAKKSMALYPDEYTVNVEALEQALPKDLTAGEISVRLGTAWIPSDVIQQFVYELLQTPGYARQRIRVYYTSVSGTWNISEKSADRSNIRVHSTYGTVRINAYRIIEESLNLHEAQVWDTKIGNDGKEQRFINKKETAIAQAKQEIIRTKFVEWIWKEPKRRERLCRLYNDRFNSIKPRTYDGSHLKFPEMNPEITLRQHQLDAIARIIYGGNSLLAHEVGAGKTFEMVAAAMESKRLGLCSKSLIVVPNHITEQWAGEFLQLYPAANILVATKKDFEKKNRKRFCARISTGDYDAVIIGHSQFEKIPMSVERQKTMMERQINEIMAGIEEVKRNKGERYTIKAMEAMKKNLIAKLEKLFDESHKDDVVTFEELGVDRLFIDEAHFYKNLFIITKMRNVGGIAQRSANKSADLFLKCRYLDELTDGRGIIFATGTFVSNSMVELYTMQRYLQYILLEQMDLLHFDSWASAFGETVTAIELAPEGTGYRAKTRFAKFYNLPELMSAFRMVADIQTADMLQLPVPKANFHTEVIKPSKWQKEMVLDLAKRAESIRKKEVKAHEDNMLLVTNDGRKLALDQRLMNPMLPDDPDSKVAACANNVFRIWEETKEDKLTQLVFCDLSTPDSKDNTIEMIEVDGVWVADERQFKNVYEDLRQKLVNKGIPRDEIAFIHEAGTNAKKEEMFAKVRKGIIRVLMGSTQKMGAGTNAQDRLIALHDLDCPWKPSCLAQRLGRIVRQGNRNKEVEIFRYVTEGTFDSYLYQLIENKQKFIAQIMTSKTPVRIAEDVDETALSYAEIKALATGNPNIIEKCQLEMDVNKLKLLQASYLNQKYALEDLILKELPQKMQITQKKIEGYRKDIETIAKYPADKEYFSPMKIGEHVYTEKAVAGRKLVEACNGMTSPDPVQLGTYRGFEMILSFDGFAKEYRITFAGALSHSVVLGSDIHGNITRLDNVFGGFEPWLKSYEDTLEETGKQWELAKQEVEQPFSQEQEFVEKSKRLQELNILLNMDEKDSVMFEDEKSDDGCHSKRIAYER